jgi:hypothetical protein
MTNTPRLPSLSQPVPLVTLLLPSFSVGQAQVTSSKATETKTATSAPPPSCDTSRENQRAYLVSVLELALLVSDEGFSFLDDDDAEIRPTNS